jgi:hypothetical protein
MQAVWVGALLLLVLALPYRFRICGGVGSLSDQLFPASSRNTSLLALTCHAVRVHIPAAELRRSTASCCSEPLFEGHCSLLLWQAERLRGPAAAGLLSFGSRR